MQGQPPAVPDPRGLHQYRSAAGQGQMLRIMLGTAVALSVVLLARALAGYLKGDPYGAAVTEDAQGAVLLGALAQTFWTFLYVGTGLVYAGWMYRVAKNNLALGATGLTWDPGWCWGGWFIPFANWVIPFLVLREMWKASDPGTPPGPGWRSAPVWAGISWWWVLWVTVALLQIVAFTAGFAEAFRAGISTGVARDPNLPGWLHLVDAATFALLVPAGFLAMHYTRLLEARQETRRANEHEMPM